MTDRSDHSANAAPATALATRSEATAAPLAAIDIGTNSFHLLVAQPVGEQRFEVLDREKDMVRLGSGPGDMKRLEPDAIDRGVAALDRFRRIAAISGADIHAVATSAVREAENRNEFLDRARDEAGVHVEVISGAEEARLIHLGVLQSVPVSDRRVLLLDIGGGSTEFVVGEGREVLEALSLKLGAIRLTQRFLARDPVRKRDLAACRDYVRAYLTHPVRRIRDLGFDVAVGSSGTIVNMAQMVHAGRGGEPLKTMGNFTFDAAELAAVMGALTSARSIEERLAVPGLDPKRADIILGGAIVLEQAFAEFDITAMTVSDFALREGLLLDALRRREQVSVGHLRDLRRQSVEHLGAICPGERAHAEHATRLALELYEATRDLHGLDDRCEEWLEAAGLLANVGLFVSHDRHHLHSYYIIRNSDLLLGFTDHEIELIAQIARYHRKSAPRSRHQEFARLGPDDKVVVRTLASILRLGIALDRTRAGIVSAVRARVEPRLPSPAGNGARANVQGNDGDDAAVGTVVITAYTDGRDARLELYTAESRKGLFEEAFGVKVAFVADPVPAPV